MPGRIRSVTGHQREPLVRGWQIAAAPPDANQATTPEPPAGLEWIDIDSPGTVAAALRGAGRWSLDGPLRRFDADDWWYRTAFSRPWPAGDWRTVLDLQGLATAAEVWLNGRMILSSGNMFLGHEICIDDLLAGDNELILRFRSLDALLAQRRPRPRWRAPMVEHQQLRWWRTTLLGRTPGWSPPAAPVGPWRPIWLERREHVEISAPALSIEVLDGAGVVSLDCGIHPLDGSRIRGATLRVERAGSIVQADLNRVEENGRFQARLEVRDPELWWPHTHGDPALYRAWLRLEVEARGQRQQLIEAELGPIGFRTVGLDTTQNSMRVSVNHVPVFCRGACWTPLDPVGFSATAAQYRDAVGQARQAGMNMLRVGGTMVYETEAFLDECDAQGVMLWQEFMFANMDYPQDEAFEASVRNEARQQLQRWVGRPALTVLCGNSEVEQQAAMWGALREHWSPRLFHDVLRAECAQNLRELPYWPSSAHGGAFPHQNNAGTTSYYGVGAYLRPLEDARRSELRFATECLAFANIPEQSCISRMPGGQGLKVHQPQWKARTPRDLGAGWDFEDVRDHYLRQWAGVDPMELRQADHERYLELGRVVTGEMMYSAFAEWRRQRSTCTGALVWFLRDLWPGAGWGIVDSVGEPKAPYYFLRRALQPRAVFISDEGCNGLVLHVVNDSAQPLEAELSLALFRGERKHADVGRLRATVRGHGTLEVPAASLFDGFSDLSYAYRFGPRAFDVAVATLRQAESSTAISEACYLPEGPQLAQVGDPGLQATAVPRPGGDVVLELASRSFAQAVHVHVEGFACEDQYFNLPPGARRLLVLHPLNPGAQARGDVRALNAVSAVPIVTQAPAVA